MPRCVNGHETALGFNCSVCGAQVSYKDACRELTVVPKVEPQIQRVAALFVGFPSSDPEGTSVVRLTAGEADVADKETFEVARTGSGSWRDFDSKYRAALDGWLRAMGFDRSPYRLVVVNTMDPLSVLALSAIPPGSGTVVFAVIADAESTPLQQNTSYVALRTAAQRGLPVVVCSNERAQEAAFFVEGEGFAVGERALARVINLIASVIGDIAQSVADDLKLGVSLHCFSAVLAASDSVYRKFDDAFSVQLHGTSLDIYPDEVQTVFLAAFAKKESGQEIERSFSKYRSGTLKNVVTAGHRVYSKGGNQQLYDLLALYGIRESEVFPLLADGYQKVAERTSELKLEQSK